MTIAVDLGRKATKQTNKQVIRLNISSDYNDFGFNSFQKINFSKILGSKFNLDAQHFPDLDDEEKESCFRTQHAMSVRLQRQNSRPLGPLWYGKSLEPH